MTKNWMGAWFVGLTMLPTGILLHHSGDTIYGTITAVRSAEVMVLDYGQGQYTVRIVGITTPRDTAQARAATAFVRDLVLNKAVRLRFEGRRNGQMIGRLFTGDPGVDVGVELLRAGLVRKQPNYDYKYGELAAAENEARTARRGVWAPGRQ
jgi:endonuclease YncB( thermonuclease family)